MGLLSFFSKPKTVSLTRLPSGSFIINQEGQVMTSTLPQWFPAEHLDQISRHVLAAFRNAQKAQVPLSELIIQYAALKLLARELRGGAIVFLMPQAFQSQQKVRQPENLQS